jgi:hypothetical protein
MPTVQHHKQQLDTYALAAATPPLLPTGAPPVLLPGLLARPVAARLGTRLRMLTAQRCSACRTTLRHDTSSLQQHQHKLQSQR